MILHKIRNHIIFSKTDEKPKETSKNTYCHCNLIHVGTFTRKTFQMPIELKFTIRI